MTLMRMIVASAVGVVFAGGLSSARGIEEVAKLTPSDAPEYGGGFGRAVAISGSFIAVGAPYDRPPTEQFGSVYVFHRTNGSWLEQEKVTASTQIWGDKLGTSVAIDDDTIVAGAPGTGDAGGTDSRAYVFRYDGFGWNEEAELIPSGSFDGDYFGISVSISGDLIAVGAPGWEFSPSQVYVFRRDGTTWTEEGILVGTDTDYDDDFGWTISAGGDLVVVGAQLDDHAGDASGSAYVFRYDGEDWAQDAKLTASDAGAEQTFGAAVGLSDGLVLVGGGSSTFAGAVYVYEHQEGSWVETTRLEAADAAFGDAFGNSLGADANAVVVGAIGDDDAGSLSGSAYLFRCLGSEWVQVAKYLASDGSPGDFFGWSASIDGDTAVVGVNGPRAAYVFDTSIEIPTVSSWGVIILALSLVLAGGVIFHRRRHTSQAPCSVREMISSCRVRPTSTK